MSVKADGFLNKFDEAVGGEVEFVVAAPDKGGLAIDGRACEFFDNEFVSGRNVTDKGGSAVGHNGNTHAVGTPGESGDNVLMGGHNVWRDVVELEGISNGCLMCPL